MNREKSAAMASRIMLLGRVLMALKWSVPIVIFLGIFAGLLGGKIGQIGRGVLVYITWWPHLLIALVLSIPAFTIPGALLIRHASRMRERAGHADE